MKKNKKSDIRFPRVGQRIVRSVIAVALCFIIYFLRGKQGIPFYSALAVLQCMQPYQDSTLKMAKRRTVGTLIGAFWGLVVILIELYINEGNIEHTVWSYLFISFFTGIVLYSAVLLQVKDAAYFSCVVFLSITVMHITDANPYFFVMNRVLDTLIGVAMGILVNAVHFPGRKRKDILFVSGMDDTLISGKSRLSSYSLIELNRLIDSGANFTISTIQTPASIRESLSGVKWKLPVIAMDGAVLYDMNNNEYILKKELTEEQTKRMTDFLEQEDFGYFMNVILEDLLIIFYKDLKNEAQRGIYESKKRSPYRNYVSKNDAFSGSAVYLLVIDYKEKIEKLYEKIKVQSWYADYRFVMADSQNYNGFAHIKIYNKDVSRVNMLENLKRITQMENTVTFGSVKENCDVFIHNADKDEMVKQMKKIYEYSS